jgi:hypothetical protein
MRDRYNRLVQQLQNSVMNTPGATDIGLRQALAAHVSAMVAGGSLAANSPVPAALRAYVDKVARHAYRVTDEEVEALGRAGYSEDAIFEITASVALAAGLGRLERGLAALKGDV